MPTYHQRSVNDEHETYMPTNRPPCMFGLVGEKKMG